MNYIYFWQIKTYLLTYLELFNRDLNPQFNSAKRISKTVSSIIQNKDTKQTKFSSWYPQTFLQIQKFTIITKVDSKHALWDNL